MNADQLLTDLGPGSTVGNKGRKRGQIWSNRINIGERNEPSGGLGREKGRPPPFPGNLPRKSKKLKICYFGVWFKIYFSVCLNLYYQDYHIQKKEKFKPRIKLYYNIYTRNAILKLVC